MSDDLDSILEAIKGPAAGGAGSIDPVTLMIMQMQNDRADRAASRQMMIQMVTALAPLILPMIMGKKEADPVLMTLLSGLLNKNNDGEQLKNFMQMMAAASNMSMEQMKTSMLGIMEMKDQQTKKMLEDARNNEGEGGDVSGPAAIMREIRLGLGSVVSMLPQGGAPAQPAPQAALPHSPVASNPPSGQQPHQQRPPPIVVVLHQLQAIQTGKVKETPAAWSALSCVALQDEALLVALDDCTDEDLQPLFVYCLPHFQAVPALMVWLKSDGVAQWIDKKVRTKLLPLIDAAREDEEEPENELHQPPSPGDNEPEELQPEAGAEG